MSSKLTVKPSKKERPRSSDKLKRGSKREGTPDKSNTPSQDALPEEGLQADKKPVLMNDEIRALQIKPESLEQLREPRPPSDRKKSPVVHPVVVRKLKPASEWDKPSPRFVTVAKPAPPDAPLKPTDYSNASGLRFDETGNIVPHSILGSVEDYKRAALEHGDLPAELLQPKEDVSGDLTVKYEKKKRRLPQYPKYESVDESNALKNWQKRMAERRKQQDHLSKLLDKAPDRLVMNQADSYRTTQEKRYIIDRTIATMDYGKGYRIGSEFWKQQERVGDDLTGMHMTLTQTEKGYPPPIEHVGVPNVVQKEKGSDWPRPRTPFHKPWHKSPYLQQRQAQLQPVMTELDPYHPDVAKLQVVGSKNPQSPPPVADNISDEGTTMYDDFKQEFMERENDDVVDPLSDHPDVYPAPVFGPSLRFAGQSARWTGDSSAFNDQAGIEARVSFEAYAGDRVTSFLEIVNDGTTCIYYNWKKIPKIDPFEMMAAKVQRFYFNTSSGVILPGDTIKFPFVFKSPNAGVFSEQWTFQTKPVVCGGASLVVTLRGVALQKDKYKKQRTELEQELAHKQAQQIVSGLLDSMLDGIRTPDRPSSPIDAYITEEEIFTRKNPELYYCAETVARLKILYKDSFPPKEETEVEEGPKEGDDLEENEEGLAEVTEEITQDEVEWDLSVENLKQHLMSLDEEEEQKQELLQRLNLEMISLSFPPFSPKQQQMYNAGYLLLSELVDAVTGESISLRASLGMPEKEIDDIPDEPRTPKTTVGLSRSPTRTDLKTPASRESRKKGQKDAKGDKDKKSSAKDSKGTASKMSAKDASRGGKVTPAGGKRAVSRDKERPSSATSGIQSPIPEGGDPVLEAKYRDKLYTRSYELVIEAIEHIAFVFEEMQQEEGGPQLPVLT